MTPSFTLLIRDLQATDGSLDPAVYGATRLTIDHWILKAQLSVFKSRGGSRIFYTLVKHVVSAYLGGSWDMPPRKMFEVWVSENGISCILIVLLSKIKIFFKTFK